MSKLDIQTMQSEIDGIVKNDEYFGLEKTWNPTGTLKYWTWVYKGELIPKLTTHESYWLLKGILVGLKWDAEMYPPMAKFIPEEVEKEKEIAKEKEDAKDE